jgi:hypothetical protein
VNTTSSSSGEVFKCTPVFILGEEQQCSDSGSDSVSEISTDSSSDRSSIYSDDSLDFILYGKTSQGRVSFPFSASESQSWKQRGGAGLGPTGVALVGAAGAGSGLRHGPRVWPRECNGVVSKALSRFSTGEHQLERDDEHHRHHHHGHHHHHHHHHHYREASGAGVTCKTPTLGVGSGSGGSGSLASSSATRSKQRVSLFP